uniref:Far upstream element-binding protein 2-like n=1 Tax=Sinocyclocheilus rhinocerous TaxID=307959 RepID=A0A673GK38_9TELE
MSEYSAMPPPGAGGFKKDAFADAVQRARQIAAKIGGDVTGPPMSNNGGAESYAFAAQKRSLEDGGTAAERRISLSVRRWRLTETTLQHCVLIGRGGEQISKIQQESGCKVQIAPDSGGLPDRSVSLTGGPEAIQKAKMLLDDIVSRGRGTPPSFHESTNGNGHMQEMIIPPGKAGLIIGKGGETIKQLQERAGVKMILIQDASQGPNMDKPLRIIGDPYKVQQAREMVQEILRERDHPGFDRNEYGSQIGGGMEVPVPRHSVVFRSSRFTDNIKHGGNKVMLLQVGPPGTGMPPGGRGRGRGPGNWGPPGSEMTFSIPAHKCGLVIGRGGENVKAINQETGAFVEISRQPPPNGDPNFKMFIIRGSPQQIDHAKQLIEDKIEGPLCPVGPGPGPGPGGPGPAGPMGPYNPNPYQPGPPGGPPHGGPPGGQYPQGWGNTYQQWQPHDPTKAAADHNAAWAAYYAQYYQQPGGAAMPGQAPAAQPTAPAPADQSQAVPGAAQPDYTKAWEEYYKKMAAAGGGAAPAAGGAQAPGAAAAGQTDYSAAWAEYYRQQAAYYGQTGQAAGQPGATPQGQQVHTHTHTHTHTNHRFICV